VDYSKLAQDRQTDSSRGNNIKLLDYIKGKEYVDELSNY
jgi:hypothetical protein